VKSVKIIYNRVDDGYLASKFSKNLYKNVTGVVLRSNHLLNEKSPESEQALRGEAKNENLGSV